MAVLASAKKYKSIVVSIIIFILIDISVLAFSFYISYQISQDAAEINLAGRQRTLSQRITKNLLEFERAYHKSRPYDAIIADIEASMQAFDTTLSAFDVGGDVVVDERIVSVKPLGDPAGRQAIETAKPMWEIYKNYTADVLKEFKGRESINEDLVTIFFRESVVKDVVVYTTSNNIDLLNVMNDMTSSVEFVAAEKTKKLRRFQALAIFIAVVNFFFIILFSLRRLHESDEELFFAKTEMDVMLDNITEGVFLLDKNLAISDHYSKEMELIFLDVDLKGKSLLHLLRHISDDLNGDGVSKFLHALFDKEKSIQVLNTLNPLQELHVTTGGVNKYLRFCYARVENETEVERVLVRVADISEQVLKEVELKEERERQFKHLRLIAAIMNSNADVLPLFFKKGFTCFDILRKELAQYQMQKQGDLSEGVKLLKAFLRESELMALDALVESLHGFLAKLKKLQESPYSEKRCANVLQMLKDVENHTKSMSEFSQDAALANRHSLEKNSSSSVSSEWLHLNQFVNEVALSHHKEVSVTTTGLNEHELPKNVLRLLNSIILQVLYHSVVNSIELPEDRRYLRKSKSGCLDVRLAKKTNGGYYLAIKNDGNGADIDYLTGLSDQPPTGKINKKILCAILLHACDPVADRPQVYEGDLLFGDQLVDLVWQADIRFDIKSVSNEGCVFEFMLPARIDALVI